MGKLSARVLMILQDCVNEMDAALGDVCEGIEVRASASAPVKTGELKASGYVVKGDLPGYWVVGFSADHAAVIHAGYRKGKKLVMHSGEAQFLRISVQEMIPDLGFFLAGRVRRVLQAS